MSWRLPNESRWVGRAGAALLVDAHRWQEQVFGELTEGWTDRQRADLQRDCSGCWADPVS